MNNAPICPLSGQLSGHFSLKPPNDGKQDFGVISIVQIWYKHTFPLEQDIQGYPAAKGSPKLLAGIKHLYYEH
jgi:hypothetical protein